MIRLLDG